MIGSACPNPAFSTYTIQRFLSDGLVKVRADVVMDENGKAHAGRRYIVDTDLLLCQLPIEIERADLNQKESLIVWSW
jgi:hypothetical protein